MIQRRGFLMGLLAAPVIVKATSLMAVKPIYGGVALSSMAHPGSLTYEELDFDTNELIYKAYERYHVNANTWKKLWTSPLVVTRSA